MWEGTGGFNIEKPLRKVKIERERKWAHGRATQRRGTPKIGHELEKERLLQVWKCAIDEKNDSAEGTQYSESQVFCGGEKKEKEFSWIGAGLRREKGEKEGESSRSKTLRE